MSPSAKYYSVKQSITMTTYDNCLLCNQFMLYINICNNQFSVKLYVTLNITNFFVFAATNEILF